MSGLYERVDGGFGFSLAEPFWDLEMELSEYFKYEGIKIEPEYINAIHKILSKFSNYLNNRSISIKCNSKIESHIGLGSKTAFSLSIGKLISKLLGINCTTEEIANYVERGGTSGVGVNLFDQGGFVIDIGHNYPNVKNSYLPSSSSKSSPPKKMMSLKNNSFKIVHFRFSDKGIFGEREKQLFIENCPLPHADTKEIISRLYLEIIPGLIEENSHILQNGLKMIQNVGFKKIEWENQNKLEKEFSSFWSRFNEKSALCLSSMGPTLFYVGEDYESALETIDRFGVKPLHINISSINNCGFKITEL